MQTSSFGVELYILLPAGEHEDWKFACLCGQLDKKLFNIGFKNDHVIPSWEAVEQYCIPTGSFLFFFFVFF